MTEFSAAGAESPAALVAKPLGRTIEVLRKVLRLLANRSHRACPECGQGKFERKEFIRATCVDEHGQSYPDHWSYRLCTSCGARLKLRSNGILETAPEDEWALYVDRNREPM